MSDRLPKKETEEIDLRKLKSAVNAVFDHIIDDIGIEKVKIDDGEDFYWSFDPPELYDVSKKPDDASVGRLSDDESFASHVRRGDGADVAFNFVHIAPLLLYVAHKIKR